VWGEPLPQRGRVSAINLLRLAAPELNYHHMQ
jgi:hypothetical protein